MKTIISIICLFIIGIISVFAQQDPGNYDEQQVPSYNLPDPLVFNNGSRVLTREDWEKRRSEIYNLFSNEIYGKIPEYHGETKIETVSHKEKVLCGRATREEILLKIINEGKELDLLLLVYLPVSSKPVPVFLGYNFFGNQTITEEPDITLTKGWVRNNESYHILENKATEASRGKASLRWPIKEIISRGYGIVTLNYGDVAPDSDNVFKNGVHALLNQQRDSSSWGCISAWAWGLSRVMDYLETNSKIDKQKVIVMGHSRLGKTALWAGASDQRFAITISNNSGRVGAALTKRIFGEPLEYMNRVVPHWFCDNFKKYVGKEALLPVDQHELIALIAPRPVYVASAENDLWADPKGEFLSCLNASPVYKFLGKEGFPALTVPPLNQPVIGTIGYHIRPGDHNVTEYDWQRFMNFADFHFNNK